MGKILVIPRTKGVNSEEGFQETWFSEQDLLPGGGYPTSKKGEFAKHVG